MIKKKKEIKKRSLYELVRVRDSSFIFGSDRLGGNETATGFIKEEKDMRKVYLLITLVICIGITFFTVDYIRRKKTIAKVTIPQAMVADYIYFSEPEFSSLYFVGNDYTYEIDAEGLRSLSSEEAIKVAVAIQLFDNDMFWADDMTNAIIETFVPARFKVKEEIQKGKADP